MPPKYKNILTAISTLILIACCYFGVFHSHRYFRFNLPVVVVIVGVLCLVAIDHLSFGSEGRWQRFRTFMVILIVGGPIAIFTIILHKAYVSQQLADHGTETYGVVRLLYSKKTPTRRSYYTSYHAKFEYSVNGKNWVQNVNNDDHSLSVGDTIRLKCSAEDPEVFDILNKKERFNLIFEH